mgnify:CR=1 FL=1
MNLELPDVDALLLKMAGLLGEHVHDRTLLVGIHTGGAWIAERLHQMLALPSPMGTLDITFYRDDFSTVGLHPQVKASSLPVDVEDRDIFLVDDVLQTGRTIRAGLNEIFSFGRPASVRLAVLLDRGARELPIQDDVCGATLDLPPSAHVKMIGPSPLQIQITSK